MEIYYAAVIAVRPDGRYVASFPDLPDCVAVGHDVTHAAVAAGGALQRRLTALLAQGRPLPGATALDALPPAEPGAVATMVRAGPFPPRRVHLTIDSLLLTRIDEAAQRAGTTRSKLLADAAWRLAEAIHSAPRAPA